MGESFTFQTLTFAGRGASLSEITFIVFFCSAVLAVYLSSVMATTGLSLFVTVIILHLNYKDPSRPVPNWVSTALSIRRRRGVTAGNNNVSFTDNESGNTLSNQTATIAVGVDQEKTKGSDSIRSSAKWTTPRHDMGREDQWKRVARRLDTVCLFLFLSTFALLLIIIAYPYDTLKKIDKNDCSFG